MTVNEERQGQVSSWESVRNGEHLTLGIPVADVGRAFPSILRIFGGWLGVFLMVLAPFNHFLKHAR